MKLCSSNITIFTPIADDGVMWFMVIAMPTIALLGFIGNLLSFIILSQSSSKVSSYFYIRCLTIFDSLSLIFTMIGYYAVLVLHPILLCRHSWYRLHSQIWVKWGSCQARTYLAFNARTLSIWTIVIFTFERMLSIKFPMFSLKYCSVKTAKKSILLLIGISLICNINWIFSFEKVIDHKTNVVLCRSNVHMLKYRILDSVMLSIVPSTIIIICNIIIVYTLRGRWRKSNSQLIAYQDPNSKKRDMKVTLQLLAVSFTFVVLTTPNCISTIINTIIEWHGQTYFKKGSLADFFHFSFFLFTLNFATNFILYCFIGDNFRMAAWNLFICKWRKMSKYRRALFESVTMSKSNDSLKRNMTIDTNSSNKSFRHLIKHENSSLARPFLDQNTTNV